MRGQQAARSRKLEAERRKRDEHMPVREIPQNELWAVAYRLSARHQAFLTARIREVEAERQRRLRDGEA